MTTTDTSPAAWTPSDEEVEAYLRRRWKERGEQMIRNEGMIGRALGLECGREDLEAALPIISAHLARRQAEEIERLREKNRSLVAQLDDLNGTPCEQIRHRQEVEDYEARLAHLQSALTRAQEALAFVRHTLEWARNTTFECSYGLENPELRAEINEALNQIAALSGSGDHPERREAALEKLVVGFLSEDAQFYLEHPDNVTGDATFKDLYRDRWTRRREARALTTQDTAPTDEDGR